MTKTPSSSIDNTQEEPVNKPIQALLSFVLGIISIILLLLFFSSMVIRTGGGGLFQSQLAMMWFMLSVLAALFGFMLGLLSRHSIERQTFSKIGLGLSSVPLIVMVLMPVFTVIMYIVKS